MFTELLNYLRCPECGESLELTPLLSETTADGDEVSEGLLCCARREHWFPIVRGIPRMLPGALDEHWGEIEQQIPHLAPESIRLLLETHNQKAPHGDYDRRTRANFNEEWGNHDLGGNTWGMRLEDRVKWFFLEPVRLSPKELRGKVMLDAGCGNGSQSVAYTKFGVEVIAIDLSSGLEHGHAFRSLHPGAQPAKVHFIQGDLQRPPLAPASLDLIHSAGVLHHTPDTRKTFRALRPLLQPGGTFYVWLYKYEPKVTPIVNAIRAATTKIPAAAFARVSQLMAAPFQGFCATVNALGIRAYPRMSRREAVLALMDIFGAPYAHYHSFEEVTDWYKAEGFGEVWSCNNNRRGFGICGRLAAAQAEEKQDGSLNHLAMSAGQGG